MAQPQQGDFSNSFPSILLVLMMSVGAFWVGVPLPSSRPSEAPVTLGRYAAPQNIDARLWQDPLAAIKNPASKSSQTIEIEARPVQVREGSVQAKVAVAIPPASSTADAQAPVCTGMSKNESLQVMAVMVGGAPYAEAAEGRRRTRYAVVSGLGRSGYVPEDDEHIGNFTASVETQPGATESIAIPFEWFRYDDIEKPSRSKKHVLVLWINETPIRDRPLAGIKRIVEQTCPCAGNRATVLLGPSSSDTLRAMLLDVKNSDVELQAFLKTLRIYSPRATAPDEYLLQRRKSTGAASNDGPTTVASELMGEVPGLQFHRTIATDYAVAESLADELHLRDVYADDGIVLISEWDTTYGRALPKAFEDVMKSKGPRPASKRDGSICWIKGVWCEPKAKGPDRTLWHFSYLRGLDGKLPGDDADKKTAPDKKSRDTESQAIETTFGNQQKDYLRRIAVRVADLDQRLKNACKKEDGEKKACKKDGVKAIGILGSDVYDKLLILKVLRLRFPEVIFFTTDLDTALLHAEEWPTARNLVVASGYGLRLNGWLQREIPPFRDGYQTAYFLSVLATFQLEGKETREITRLASRWTASPRIFEIGRSQEVDLSKTVSDDKACDLATCKSPHPYVERPMKPGWGQILFVSLLLLGVWLYQIKQVVDLPNTATAGIGVTLRRVLVGLTLVLMAGLSWVGFDIWKDIFVTGTAGGGEPFSWFEGVSIWPSVLLRAFTGLLALYLLLRGMRHLYKSDVKLTVEFFGKDMDCPKPESCWRRIHTAVCAWLDAVKRLAQCLKHPTQEPPGNNEAEPIWRDAVQPRPFTLPQSWRLIVGVALLSITVATLFVIISGELPNLPYRGAVAKTTHLSTLGFAIVSFLFLLAFVIDSTHRTYCLARRLGDNRKRTQWPHAMVLEWFPQSVQTQPESVSRYQGDWIDIQLIAARTTVVGGFIYYPFIILSLLILARSSFIDNWQIPIGLGLIFAFFLSIAIVCALLLRNAAESARRHALEHISQEIVKALGDATRKQEVEQMKLMKEAILAEHRGAFSSFLHQPWLKALLLPLGSYSGIQLFESLSLINL